MRKLQILALTLIFCFVAAWPQERVSAIKRQHEPSTYAPGEIIIKLKESARELNAADLSERAISIARVIGKKADGPAPGA
jgi:hypothetical protein